MFPNLFRKKDKNPDPVKLLINDADSLAALQTLGINVEKGEGENEYFVSLNEQEPEPAPPQPPAGSGSETFINELQTAFDQIGGVAGFVNMLMQMSELLESAEQNAERELNNKKAFVEELKKNQNCTLGAETLMKMSMDELKDIKAALNGVMGDFSVLGSVLDNGSNGNNQPQPRRAIGLSPLNKKQEA